MNRHDWSPTPPAYVRRWAVQGRTPNGDAATTIFDLLSDRRGIAVYPATVDTFAVLIDRASVEILLSTLDSRDACAVPAWHSVHGDRLLGLRPFESPHEPSWTDRPADAPPYLGPIELYVRLPKELIHIVYRHGQLLALRTTLAEILESMR